MISDLLQVILDIASHLKITSVIIGGLALPAYKVARTTLDIDICINIKSQEKLDLFIKSLGEKDINEILKGFELDFDSHIRDVSKEILDKFND